MMASIGVLKALHRDRVREFKTDRKETHWGKRKLKRDEGGEMQAQEQDHLGASLCP
jgi:hypothetical protein